MSKDKKQLIHDKDPREDKIKLLQEHFPGVVEEDHETGEYNLNADKLQQILEPSKTKVVEDGYELRWVGKKLAYDDAYRPNRKLLSPLYKDSKNFEDTNNILIKGDNLDALKILRQNYFGKIKMIYIDPPYNTKSEKLLYKDNFSDSDSAILDKLDYPEDDKEYIKNLWNTKTHSRWLTFIYPRLLLAKELLKPNGLLCISIDENEYANLKIICDEIYGSENFLGDVIRKTKSTTNDASIGFNRQHEYCLIYAKNKKAVILNGDNKDFAGYKNLDNDPRGRWKSGDPSARTGTVKFAITNPHTGKIDYPPKGRCWQFSKKTFAEHVDSGKIKFKKNHNAKERCFIFKQYLSDIKREYHLVDSLFAVNNSYMNQVGTKERNKIFGEDVMDYPKPTTFIKKLILYATGSDDTVLDFFAGSGTTAHAVMEMNEDDGGNRKFIMVQLDEDISGKKKDAIKFLDSIDKPANVFEVCAERIRRAGANIEDINVDVGFKTFEIIEDAKNRIYDVPLSEIGQSALTGFKSNKVDDVLYSFMAADRITLDQPVTCIQEQKLYIVSNVAYIFAEVELSEINKIKEKHPEVEYLTIYSPNIISDSFMLQFEDHALSLGFVKDKIKVIA